MGGGKIEPVGSNDAITYHIGKMTKALDLHGAFVMPCFIESDVHMVQRAECLTQIDVGAAGNWDDIVALVGATVAKVKPGQWQWHLDNGSLEIKWNRVPQPNVRGLLL